MVPVSVGALRALCLVRVLLLSSAPWMPRRRRTVAMVRIFSAVHMQQQALLLAI